MVVSDASTRIANDPGESARLMHSLLLAASDAPPPADDLGGMALFLVGLLVVALAIVLWIRRWPRSE
jgi:hypothetical protein